MTPERTIIGVDIGGTKVAGALLRGQLPAPGARSRAGVETPEVIDRFTTLTDVSSMRACLDGIVACIADLEHGSGRVEGIGVFEIAEEAIRTHKAAFGADPVLAHALDAGGEYAWRARGEEHMWTPDAICLLYTSPSPRDRTRARMPSSA